MAVMNRLKGHPMHICHSSSIKILQAILIASMPCMIQAAQQPGTWQNVTPWTGTHYCNTIQVDPVKKSDAWAFADEVGCWKSTDYGQTWIRIDAAGGLNNTGISGHGAWCSSINPSLTRDPSIPPAVYVTFGYAENGIWKSTDGGVTWIDTWSNNIFAPDGSTNIYSDVGRDIAYFYCIDPAVPNHMIAALHSYWGTGGNNGIFESTDGGARWILHKAATFNFQPHSSVLFPIDKNTWCVTDGGGIYTTNDGAATWTKATGSISGSAGNAIINRKVGNAFYVACDHNGPIYKTTDNGLSWRTVTGLSANRTQWILATDTKLYVADAYDWDPTDIYSCDINNDAVWTKSTAALPGGGHRVSLTHDGTNFVILAPAHNVGIWRYVEPASTSNVITKNSVDAVRLASISSSKKMIGINKNLQSYSKDAIFFDVKGKRIGMKKVGTQAVVIKIK
jgi:photosystem II stability/assembly factor-like uncharacterized protein